MLHQMFLADKIKKSSIKFIPVNTTKNILKKQRSSPYTIGTPVIKVNFSFTITGGR